MIKNTVIYNLHYFELQYFFRYVIFFEENIFSLV